MISEWFHNEVFQAFFIAFLYIGGSIILIPIAVRIINAVGHWITRRTQTTLDDLILSIISRYLKWIIIISGFYFGINHLELIFHSQTGKPIVIQYANDVLYIVVVFVFSLLVIQILVDSIKWYLNRLENRGDGRLAKEFTPLIERLLKIIVFAIALIIILERFGINVSGLVVSLGVGSLAIAFAAQDTIANMIAGFVITLDRPFRLGDQVQLESGEIGTITEIGLRSTKLLTFDNTMIIIPNSKIVSAKLINLSYPDPVIRVVIDIGVAYGTDLEKVKRLLVEIGKSHKEVLKEPEPQAFFVSFGTYSLNMKVVCRVANYTEQWRIGEELRMAVKKRFEAEGIEIPYPQYVIYSKNNS